MSAETTSPMRDWLYVQEPRNLREMAQVVARQHQIPLHWIMGPSRKRLEAHARQELMWRAYQTGRYSLPAIGRFLGGRDHTTILHGVRAHAARMCGESVD